MYYNINMSGEFAIESIVQHFDNQLQSRFGQAIISRNSDLYIRSKTYPTINNINIDGEWKIEYKEINPENSRNIECPISYENFNDGCKYCICNECKYNFSKNAINKIFQINQYKFTQQCPMCRTEWNNKTIYINVQIPTFESKKTEQIIGRAIRLNHNKNIDNNYNNYNDNIHIPIILDKNKFVKTKHNKRFFYGKCG